VAPSFIYEYLGHWVGVNPYDFAEYTKIHEMIFEGNILDEIFFNANNPQNNNMFTNTKEVELYDLAYEHFFNSKNSEK